VLKLRALVLLVLPLCWSGAALAQASPASQPPAVDLTTPRAPRIRLSPLIGAAIPFAEASPVFALSEVTPPALLLGADAAWGPVLPLDFGFTVLATLGLGEPEVCPRPSSSCAPAVGGQFALRARYFFRPTQALDPWLSLGGGIDVLSSTGETTETNTGLLFDNTSTRRRTSTYYGPLGLLQAGLDWRVRRSLFLGALLGLGISSYLSAKDSVSVDGETVTSSSGSLEPRLHQWFYAAASVTFDVLL
jgi:hypothetical protein